MSGTMSSLPPQSWPSRPSVPFSDRVKYRSLPCLPPGRPPICPRRLQTFARRYGGTSNGKYGRRSAKPKGVERRLISAIGRPGRSAGAAYMQAQPTAGNTRASTYRLRRSLLPCFHALAPFQLQLAFQMAFLYVPMASLPAARCTPHNGALQSGLTQSPRPKWGPMIPLP